MCACVRACVCVCVTVIILWLYSVNVGRLSMTSLLSVAQNVHIAIDKCVG